MTTKREYLKQQGITVGVRGRFSGAAKVALQEAVQKGIVFTAEPTNRPSKDPSVGLAIAVGSVGIASPASFWYNRQLTKGGK